MRRSTSSGTNGGDGASDASQPRVAPAARRAVTLEDVAAAASVSRTTVSWVLNDRARRIPPETQTRVRETARRMGDRPNRLARHLRKGTRHTVGIVLPLSVPNAPRVLRGLSNAVRDLGYQLEIMDSGWSPDTELAAVRHQGEAQTQLASQFAQLGLVA
ncbi:MAG: LacI family DNA-binding transcriptional regulator [Actinobacteria bacterium]|nr:LacI family DNA-binding transcriptional regulator [Actinomycetota bacterium]